MAQGDHDYAMALHEEGMRVYRELGHNKGVSASLRELGFVAYEQGDYEFSVQDDDGEWDRVTARNVSVVVVKREVDQR